MGFRVDIFPETFMSTTHSCTIPLKYLNHTVLLFDSFYLMNQQLQSQGLKSCCLQINMDVHAAGVWMFYEAGNRFSTFGGSWGTNVRSISETSAECKHFIFLLSICSPCFLNPSSSSCYCLFAVFGLFKKKKKTWLQNLPSDVDADTEAHLWQVKFICN